MEQSNVIKLQVENVLIDDYGNAGKGYGPDAELPSERRILPSQKKEPLGSSGFMAGLSAQMFVSGFGQMIGATGNSQLSSLVSQGSQWGFSAATALTGNPAGIATFAFQLATLAIQKIKAHSDELKALAKEFNALILLQMQNGQVIITADTVISYNKNGQVSFTDRK